MNDQEFHNENGDTLVFLENGNFVFEAMTGLTIEGVFIGDSGDNRDTLRLIVHQEQEENQQIDIVGPAMEIPAFFNFVSLLAAHMALRETAGEPGI